MENKRIVIGFPQIRKFISSEAEKDLFYATTWLRKSVGYDQQWASLSGLLRQGFDFHSACRLKTMMIQGQDQQHQILNRFFLKIL